MVNKPTSEAVTQSSQHHRTRLRNLTLRMTSLLVIVGLFVTGVSASVTETEAYWNDSEHAISNELTATTVAPPQNFVCDAPFLLGRPWFEWDLPPEGPPEGYIVQVRHNLTGQTNEYLIDENDYDIEDGNTIVLVLSGSLLQNLLGNLLGLAGNFTARIQTVGPGEWTSNFTAPLEFYPGLLGGVVPRCID